MASFMTHPDQPEKKGGEGKGPRCHECGYVDILPMEDQENRPVDANKTMGEGPRIDGRDDRVLLAGGIFYSQRRDGILWVDAAEVHNYLKGQDLSSLSQERDELKGILKDTEGLLELSSMAAQKNADALDEMKEKADELEIVLKGLLLLRVGLSENDIIWVRAQKALAAYAKAGKGGA